MGLGTPINKLGKKKKTTKGFPKVGRFEDLSLEDASILLEHIEKELKD